MKRYIYYCIFILLSGKSVFAQNAESPSVLLNNEIDVLKSDVCLKNATWGLCVMETGTGNILGSYNADAVLEPASVMKIVTTGAALSILGPSFVFETWLEYSGNIDSAGNLNGNIYIRGGGDPTIGSKRFGSSVSTDSVFSMFRNALGKLKIKNIRGAVVADAGIYDDNPASGSWLWEDIGNYYASGAYGLNLYENYYRLYFNSGTAIGSPASLVKMEPELIDISFINHVKTARAESGDNVIIYGGPYTKLRLLEGTVPAGRENFDVDGAIPDPPELFAKLFCEYLSANGIPVDKSFTTCRELEWKNMPDTLPRKTIIKYVSPCLGDIIKPTNIKSVNLFAEAILKAAGKQKSGRGSEKAGVEAVKNFWASKNVDLKGLEMEDGCGLSRKNKISTRQLCQMLKVISKEKSYDVFCASLPVAGKSGGMAGMLKNTIAENNLKAKTGNMDEIKSYAGYVTTAGGKEVAFALVFNNYNCPNAEIKQKAEKLLLLISRLK